MKVEFFFKPLITTYHARRPLKKPSDKIPILYTQTQDNI